MTWNTLKDMEKYRHTQEEKRRLVKTHREQAEYCRWCDIPITEMNRDELLALVVVLFGRSTLHG